MSEGFDFDAWCALAKMAPEAFEEQRRHSVTRVIANSDDTMRLQGLQSRIDLERLRARTPWKACLRLSNLMWDSFLNLEEMLNRYSEIDALDTSAPQVSSKPPSSAQIIPFPNPPKRTLEE